MSNLKWPTCFIIINIFTLTPLWTMENVAESSAALFIETNQKDSGGYPHSQNSQKNFTKRLMLKKLDGKKQMLTYIGHVDYFIYPFKKECYIAWITIGVLYRNRKFGSLLMGEVKQHAQEAHCDHIRLLAKTGNGSPISFYERLGFIITKDEDYNCKTLELKLTQQKQ